MEHDMIMAEKQKDGWEEWHCPICGRRFRLCWPPNYKKVILEPGDETAVHTGIKQMGTVDLRLGISLDSGASSDGLDPWAKHFGELM